MIVGQDGPAVVLSAETAYCLERFCSREVSRLRVRTRGVNQHVAEELLELRRVAMGYDPTRLPQNAAVGSDSAEVATGLEHGLMRVAEVADRLGLSERAVRLACSQGRLEAEQVGSRWQITRQALHDFEAARAA